jgi:hypothetical protein
MSGTTTKLFFHSRQEYLQNMLYYTGLISNLVLSPDAVVPILMDFPNDMIRAWCVQILFLPMHRPDIVAEAVELSNNFNFIILKHFGKLQTTAGNALQEFCDAVPRQESLPKTTTKREDDYCHPTEAGQKELKRLGNLPAVDPLYSPQDPATAAAAGQGDGHGSGGRTLNNSNNNMTFATGLLDVVKNSHEALSMDNGRGYDSLFYCWSQLLYAFCPVQGELGESASRNLVALGLGEVAMTNPTFARSLLGAIHVYAVRTSTSTPLDSNTGEPLDVVLGSLISVGFGEMLLRLVVKHHTNSFFVGSIERHLHVIGSVALASKTNKALMKRMALWKKEMDRVKAPTTATATKRNIAKCIQTMDSILDKATMGAAESMMDDLDLRETCRWCQKPVPCSERKRCGKCQRITYCSKECQTKEYVSLCVVTRVCITWH